MPGIPAFTSELAFIIEQLKSLRSRPQLRRLAEAPVYQMPGCTRAASHLEFARHTYQSRKNREDLLGEGLFGEPAFDILVDLYVAHMVTGEVSVSSSCIASGVPQTTALRVISALVARGLVKREADPFDGRRTFLLLTTEGVARMAAWIEHTIETSPKYDADGPVNQPQVRNSDTVEPTPPAAQPSSANGSFGRGG